MPQSAEATGVGNREPGCGAGVAKGYHHGDLRNALIVAAAELIEESGSMDFSMAEAARRAGVSSAAPYRHFRDKDDLLQAVARLGYIGLTEASLDAVTDQEPGTEAAIVALGRAYIQFMVNHRPFQDLMWGDMGAQAMDADSHNLKGSGFYILVDNVSALCESESIVGEDPVNLATRLWAMVHGLANLAMNEQIDRFLPQADVCQLLQSSTRLFFDGLRYKQAMRPAGSAHSGE